MVVVVKGWGPCDRPTTASIPFMLPLIMESVVEIAVKVLVKV
jgi:hypothetical protein